VATLRQLATLGPAPVATPDAAGHDADDRGAQVFRACAVCHGLTEADTNRAGPSLHALFGRRVGTQPGFAYSPALRGMDIIWSPETVSRLFELGPTAYLPGTSMPEQRVGDPQDRAALVRFLEKVTR
jgi:cytochrome c